MVLSRHLCVPGSDHGFIIVSSDTKDFLELPYNVQPPLLILRQGSTTFKYACFSCLILHPDEGLIRKWDHVEKYLGTTHQKDFFHSQPGKCQLPVEEDDWKLKNFCILYDWKYRYKQMSLAPEQEWMLEQNKMQAELDWQHVCKNVESNWYQESEDLTQSLSSAGEQIFQYDDKISLSKNIPSLEIKRLQEQNASLRAAVAQMRKEMESLDKQMSSLPLTENGQLAEQGLLYTNKISTGTTLSNTKVSSVNVDCMANSGTEKGPKAKVIEEKMIDLEQQFPDIGPCVGLQYGVSSTLQGVQNKLKEAARQISILSEEKHQLIEIGNELRAELRTVLKEGLLHPVNCKHCTVCVVSGSLFPRELVKRIQCQLSALKHLQNRLTTQELQCAKQQHLSRISSLIVCSGLKDKEAPSRCGEKTELLSTEVQLDLSIENHWPKQQKADTFLKIVRSQPTRQSPSQAQPVQLSSSRAHNFCQGVELEVTHSEESQQNVKAKDKLEMPAADLTVRGTRLEVQQKLKSRDLSYAYPIKPKISSKVAKIRNYNVKD